MAEIRRLRRSRESWRILVKAWTKSNLSAVEFADKHDIKAASLSWWRAELRRKAQANSSKLSLIPLQVTMPVAAPPSVLEISFPNGACMKIPDNVGIARIKELVALLGAS